MHNEDCSKAREGSKNDPEKEGHPCKVEVWEGSRGTYWMAPGPSLAFVPTSRAVQGTSLASPQVVQGRPGPLLVVHMVIRPCPQVRAWDATQSEKI